MVADDPGHYDGQVIDLVERHNLLTDAQYAVTEVIKWYADSWMDSFGDDPLTNDEARFAVLERLRDTIEPFRGVLVDGQREILVEQIAKAIKLPKASIRDLFKPPPAEKKAAVRRAKAAGYRREDCTDSGNAQRFVRLHGNDLLHCDDWKSWLFWDNTHWRKDNVNRVVLLAQTVRQDLYREVSDLTKALSKATSKGQLEALEARVDETVRWAKRSGSGPQIRYMVRISQSAKSIAVIPDQLDQDRYLLNVANGTLSLATGELRPHCRTDCITNLVPIAYDPEATCPRWEQFLQETMLTKKDGCTDEDLIEFIRQAFAYSLTGAVNEQCMFVCYGSGANGKSTLLDVLMALAGDYGRTAPPNLLLASKNDQHPAEIALLRGARVVTSIESEEGRRMAEAKVKMLTGGDRRSCRGMGENWWHYDPTDKIWLAANHKPVIRGTDLGIWRRIRLIPFWAKFEGGEQDKGLTATLRDELPGILAWTLRHIEGLHERGLVIPKAVVDQTRAYRSEMDVIGDFIDECCVSSMMLETSIKSLYKAYVDWCEEGGERCLTKRKFGNRLTERGYPPREGKGTHGSRLRMGIGVRYD